MLALTHMEMARNEFLLGFVLTSIGFLVSTAFLLVLVFRPETFLRFIEWDASLDRWIGLPQWWTSGWLRFAKSKSNTIFLSILVGMSFTLMSVNLCGYLMARHHLNQKPSPNKSLQATRDGGLSSASRLTLVGPACLSSGR